jgi:hypothetical protein
MACRPLPFLALTVILVGEAPASAGDPPSAPAGPAPSSPSPPPYPQPAAPYPQPAAPYPQPAAPYPQPAAPSPYPPSYPAPYPAPYPSPYPAPYAAPYPPYAYPLPAAPTLVPRRRSSGALAAGSVFLSVGSVAVAIAVPLFHTGTQTCTFDSSVFDCSTPGVSTGVLTLLIGGIAGMVAGIPLIIYGAGSTSDPPAPASVGRGAGAPTANGWRWTF